MTELPILSTLSHAQLPDAGQVTHAELDIRPPALWRLISARELNAASGAIALGALPTGFSLWRLQLYARSDAAAERDTIAMTLNDDTGPNYDCITVAHDDPITQLVTVARAASSVAIAACEAADSRANTITPVTVDFFRPTDAAWEKTGAFASAVFGDRSAGADLLAVQGWWAWRATAAIATVTLTMTAGEFAAGSSVMLLGLRLG